MKIAEYVKVDGKMVLVYREMTQEEEEEYRREIENPPGKNPTDERVEELEKAMVVLLGGDTE